jgi:hypothetical protein
MMEPHLHSQIKKFVQRQTIVLAAMRDIRPDLVMRARDEGSPKERAEFTQRYAHSQQSGFWGKADEWEYFVHGIGCRLRHRITREPIQWDAGDLRRFDRNWFLDHLEWSLSQKPDDEDILVIKVLLAETSESLRDFVFSRLEKLRHAGILSDPDHQYRYTLLSVDEPSEIA